MVLELEATATNVFNQRQVEEYFENILASGSISPARVSRFSGDPNIDWNKVMTAYNYIDAANAQGAFAGKTATGTTIQQLTTLSNRYGLPNTFQNARTMRLAMRFTF